MQRGITVFVVGLIVVYVLLGAVVVSNGENATWAGLLALIAPFCMAFIAHRMSGAVGNPFRGLVWGPGSLLFITWAGGIVLGAIVLAVCVFGGLVPWDSSISSFLDMLITQSEEKGQEFPEQAIGMTTIMTKVGLYGTPILGAWIMAALGCLSSFPIFGWFARRMMVHGKGTAFGAVAALSFIGSAAFGGSENPMTPEWNEVALPLRMLVYGILGLSFVPAAFWLFLKSRSAVITAMASASYSAVFQGAFAFTAGGNPIIGPPSGLAVPAGILLAGVALWTLFGDPGGDDLAVAAVAHDGTPLTPAQFESLGNELPVEEPVIVQSMTDDQPVPPPPADSPDGDDSGVTEE